MCREFKAIKIRLPLTNFRVPAIERINDALWSPKAPPLGTHSMLDALKDGAQAGMADKL